MTPDELAMLHAIQTLLEQIRDEVRAIRAEMHTVALGAILRLHNPSSEEGASHE